MIDYPQNQVWSEKYPNSARISPIHPEISRLAKMFMRETVGPFDLLVSSHGYSSVAPSNMKVRCRKRSDILDARFPGLTKLKNEFYYDLKNFNKKKLDLVGNLYVLIWKPSLLIYVGIPNDPLAYYCSQIFKLILSGFRTFLKVK